MEYTQILNQKLIDIGSWLEQGSGRKQKQERIESETYSLSEEIAEILKEAEETGTFLPYQQLCVSLELGEYERLLLCILWYHSVKEGVGISFGHMRRRLQPYEEQQPSMLSPCFWQQQERIMLSPVTLAYLEGRPPVFGEGIVLEFPKKQKCYGRQQLSAGNKLLAEIEVLAEEPAALVLMGEKGSGRHFVAQQLAAEQGFALITVSGKRELANREIHELLLSLELYQALLCVVHEGPFSTSLLKKLADYVPFLLILQEKGADLLEDTGYITYIQSLELPTTEQKTEIITDILLEQDPAVELPKGVSLEMLTARQLPMGQFIRFVKNIRAELLLGTFALEKNVYQTATGQLKLLPAERTFSELKLPKTQQQQLEKICRIAAARKRVLDSWGFGKKYSYGNGISVLFYGMPGTGKTMAAQVLANTLGMPLLRVDLSQLISKYIGETQKNIGHIFDEAERCDCILLFDEADALFAKRSEVSDAQDRYSNAETAYLLQRVEQYGGISILATNLLQNFDEAFRRRITYMLHFPMPDAGLREEIWRTVFPVEAPVDADVDYAALAQAFELSGAAIKNAALHGAGFAASEEKNIGMRHLLDGICNEFQKTGKTLSDSQKEFIKAYFDS